jgi:pimeloyl-ACP methyl ester carboxylesterase
MTSINHRHLDVNGIRMHIAEQGQGPLVLMIHGYPELWYSYRHLIPAVAEAGYHAVAPDMRGYGDTDCPKPLAAYTMNNLVGDVVQLAQALGATRDNPAHIVGHDWGATISQRTAVLRPDLFSTVTLLGVPYYGERPPIRPTEAMQRLGEASGGQYYQWYFQPPGVAEAVLEKDVLRSQRMFFYSLSGSISQAHRWRYVFGRDETILDSCTDPETLPAWLTQADLEVYTQAFEKTGFRGALNWYRTQDLWWEATPFLTRRPLEQPLLFIAGEEDPVVQISQVAVENLPNNAPNLWRTVLLPGVGHWTEQEAPESVKPHLLEFLATHT